MHVFCMENWSKCLKLIKLLIFSGIFPFAATAEHTLLSRILLELRSSTRSSRTDWQETALEALGTRLNPFNPSEFLQIAGSPASNAKYSPRCMIHDRTGLAYEPSLNPLASSQWVLVGALCVFQGTLKWRANLWPLAENLWRGKIIGKKCVRVSLLCWMEAKLAMLNG